VMRSLVAAQPDALNYAATTRSRPERLAR
jgi:hypothetical protein